MKFFKKSFLLFSCSILILSLSSSMLITNVDGHFLMEKTYKEESDIQLVEGFQKPVAIAAWNQEIVVLDEELKSIQIFTQDLQLVTTINLLENKNLHVQKPRDLAIYHDEFFILDSEQHCIFVVNRKGDLIRTIGGYGTNVGKFIFPQALCIYNNQLYVGDSGNSRVQVLELTGRAISTFGEKGTAEKDFLLIKGIYASQDKIYVSDGANHKIIVFSQEGQFIESYGEKGHERGKLLHPQGLAVDSLGNIIVADTGNGRIQVFNPITNQIQVLNHYGTPFLENDWDPENEEEFLLENKTRQLQYPFDILFLNDLIYVLDTNHGRVVCLPLHRLFHDDKIVVSQTMLDFGSIAKDDVVSQTLSIQTIWNPFLKYTIQCSKDFIGVQQKQIYSYSQNVVITIHGKDLDEGSKYNENLEIISENGSVQKISLVFLANTEKNIYVEAPSFNYVETDDWNRIPLKISPQNGYEGTLFFSVIDPPDHILCLFESARYDTAVENDVELLVQTTSYLPFNSIVPIKIQYEDIFSHIHTIEILLIYRLEKNTILAPVLTEVFTATWFLRGHWPCRVFYNMSQILGPEIANFIEYYVESTKDHPAPRLSWIESEDRMEWYMDDKGLPTAIFNGGNFIKGDPTSEGPKHVERLLYEEYYDMIMKKSNVPSPIRIQSEHIFNEDKKTGKVHVAVEAFDKLPQTDLRLLIALVESNIEYSAVNGDDYHHFVLRDFITPANDDVNDYVGTPMLLPSGKSFGNIGDIFDINVDFSILDFFNPDNLSIALFVQDNVTKEVLQSVSYPLKTKEFLSFHISSDGSLYKSNTKGTSSKMQFDIINCSNVRDEFTINTSCLSDDPWNYKVTIDGKDASESSIYINPYEKATVQLHYEVPEQEDLDAHQEFQFQVESQSSHHKKEFKGYIQVVENRPPDFIIEIQKPSDLNVMAGEEGSLQIHITPDPYVEDAVTLTLLNPPSDLASYLFSPAIGNVPLDSTLTFTFIETTLEKDVNFVIQAKAGTSTKTEAVTIHVLRNPDATPPELRIASPSNNLLTNNPTLTITGMTDPTATITINDTPVDVTKNGFFEHTVILIEGDNTFDIIATNRRGLTTKKVFLVTLDVTPPVLIVDTEIPQETTKREFTITGKTEPNSILTIGNQNVFLQEDGSFSYKVKLVHGWNRIFITAEDHASNKTSLEYGIILIDKIVLQIGNLKASVNDEEVILNVSPYIKKGRTMVPLRFIAESFGLDISYDAVEQSIVINSEEVSIRLQIGNPEVYIKREGAIGQEIIILEVPAEIINASTCIPLRFIGEALGATVDWDGETQTIILKK